MKIQIVNEVNKVFTLPQQNAFSAFAFQVYDLLTLSSIMKDFVVEALRSIAELITYGDQHDPAFFEWGFLILGVSEYHCFGFKLAAIFFFILTPLQVFHGEAGHGGVCTYIKNK